jgi:hypothetical protein
MEKCKVENYLKVGGQTGTRENINSRINLEGNTHVQEINACQLPV